MSTSRIFYLPHTGRKHTRAAIVDAEYQLALRALRRGEVLPVFGIWRNCRCDPGIWELKTTRPDLTAPVRRLSIEALRNDKTIDQNALDTLIKGRHA